MQVDSEENRDCRPLDDSMTIAIALNTDCLNNLDISPAQTVIEKLLQEQSLASHEQQLHFEIDYPVNQQIHGNSQKSRDQAVVLFAWMPTILGCPFSSIEGWGLGPLCRYAGAASV
jgi:hypothetical protein